MQEFLFDRDDEEQVLTEDELYDLGFCGDVFLEDENGDEIVLSLDAANPEYYDGTFVDGLVYNIYQLNRPEDSFDDAKVVAAEVVFYED